jgi:hypothetical protein
MGTPEESGPVNPRPTGDKPSSPASFTRQWWTELITVRPYDAQHWGALQVGICVTLPLAVLLAIGRPDLAAYAVFGSLSSVYGSRFGRYDRMRAQLGTGAALTLAVVLGTVAGIPGPGSLWAIAAMAVISVLGLLITRGFGWLPVPSLFLALATGTISAASHTWGDVPVAFGIAASAALFGALMGQLSLALRRGMIVQPAPSEIPLSQVLRSPGIGAELTYYFAGPSVAWVAASLVGYGHPYWAAVSATVPLSGRTLAAQLARATLRFVGTAVGIGIAYLVLASNPPIWALVAAVAVFQFMTELFVTRNYGIAAVFITPLALILGQIGAPIPPATLVVDRLVQTTIGVAIAVIVLLVVDRASGLRLRQSPAEN